MPIIVMTATIVFPIGNHLLGIYGTDVLMYSGTFFVTVSLMLGSYIKNPMLFIYFYGIVFGIGKGLLFPTVLEAAISQAS